MAFSVFHLKSFGKDFSSFRIVNQQVTGSWMLSYSTLFQRNLTLILLNKVDKRALSSNVQGDLSTLHRTSNSYLFNVRSYLMVDFQCFHTIELEILGYCRIPSREEIYRGLTHLSHWNAPFFILSRIESYSLVLLTHDYTHHILIAFNKEFKSHLEEKKLSSSIVESTIPFFRLRF